MAVWLKCANVELAFAHDIVPREAMRSLERLDELDDIASETLAGLRAEAEAEAEGIRAAARADAQAIAAKAQLDAASVTRLGYAQGRRDALRHWHAEAVQQRQQAAERFGGQRKRLADMVVQATASLLQGPAMASYMEQALQALDTLAEKDLTLSVTVHPDEEPLAREAIEKLRPRWRDNTVVKLIVSDAVAPGSCICESPQGYADGSLSQQLATLRQAAMGALEDLEPLPHPVEQAAPPVPQSPPSLSFARGLQDPLDPGAPGAPDALGALGDPADAMRMAALAARRFGRMQDGEQLDELDDLDDMDEFDDLDDLDALGDEADFEKLFGREGAASLMPRNRSGKPW
ncbi:hypothetical protein GT347_19700 [Xylophilus rhododendri]|uniref:Uncharacterized protein n=1 Tax=Xylophilus rhododendri TaxID=2697032 RepID=A0A857JAE3_9BURK|nr:hypothetical protein [Xylophilus rhododendri]QHJ00010.1 hypothetical protein GT347_19700 [Xylophilus rhododendri]